MDCSVQKFAFFFLLYRVKIVYSHCVWFCFLEGDEDSCWVVQWIKTILKLKLNWPFKTVRTGALNLNDFSVLEKEWRFLFWERWSNSKYVTKGILINEGVKISKFGFNMCPCFLMNNLVVKLLNWDINNVSITPVLRVTGKPVKAVVLCFQIFVIQDHWKGN